MIVNDIAVYKTVNDAENVVVSNLSGAACTLTYSVAGVEQTLSVPASGDAQTIATIDLKSGISAATESGVILPCGLYLEASGWVAAIMPLYISESDDAAAADIMSGKVSANHKGELVVGSRVEGISITSAVESTSNNVVSVNVSDCLMVLCPAGTNSAAVLFPNYNLYVILDGTGCKAVTYDDSDSMLTLGYFYYYPETKTLKGTSAASSRFGKFKGTLSK